MEYLETVCFEIMIKYQYVLNPSIKMHISYTNNIGLYKC